MTTTTSHAQIYDGHSDDLIVETHLSEKITIIPDGKPSRQPDVTRRLRIMWGQHLLDDVLAGRYRSLVCAVNTEDNSHGIISQLATLLRTSMWTPKTITEYARQFTGNQQTAVLKFDMDIVEVLALLRPSAQDEMALTDLGHGFEIVSEMLRRKTQRLPTASVSFLGAHANRLAGAEPGTEPSFETVLRVMNDAGFAGDVYPSVKMWDSHPTAVYARYPFPESVEQMRDGGY